jgi:hypothetical protein
VKQLALAKVES